MTTDGFQLATVLKQPWPLSHGVHLLFHKRNKFKTKLYLLLNIVNSYGTYMHVYNLHFCSTVHIIFVSMNVSDLHDMQW